jgi:4-azaleucine resistance transporter AzlC
VAVEAGFWRGFRAMVPLWIGVVPFGLAFAVLARGVGLSALETQALSLFVFAGSAQVSAVGLLGRGAGGVEIVATTFLLNVRHVLYGLSLGRSLPLTGIRRALAAFFLTDEAFGVVTASRVRSYRFLLGTELSLFIVWNLATLAGALLGGTLPDPVELGVDTVFPLAFVALLVPLLHTRVDVTVALAAGLSAWIASETLPSWTPVLVAGVGGSLLGAALTSGRAAPPAEGPHDHAPELGGRQAREGPA